MIQILKNNLIIYTYFNSIFAPFPIAALRNYMYFLSFFRNHQALTVGEQHLEKLAFTLDSLSNKMADLHSSLEKLEWKFNT